MMAIVSCGGEMPNQGSDQSKLCFVECFAYCSFPRCWPTKVCVLGTRILVGVSGSRIVTEQDLIFISAMILTLPRRTTRIIHTMITQHTIAETTSTVPRSCEVFRLPANTIPTQSTAANQRPSRSGSAQYATSRRRISLRRQSLNSGVIATG